MSLNFIFFPKKIFSQAVRFVSFSESGGMLHNSTCFTLDRFTKVERANPMQTPISNWAPPKSSWVAPD